jgi:RNA polymerase sigma-70 factor (ECF subfamily)
MDLTSFIKAYRGPLIGLIASWGAPWTEAAELAQDSFAEAWAKRDLCRGDWRNPEVFGRWLRGVAYNKYRNWWRNHRRDQARITTVDEVGDRSGPDQTLDQRLNQRIDALRHAIDRLPAKQKEVVLMHYLEETSVKEVATLLSVSAKTVEGRLYQARRALYRMLEGTPPASTARRLLCL